MKTQILFALLLSAPLAFAQVDALKSQAADLKKKGCKVVNGKEECTAEEVKVKAMELKTKALEAKKKLKP